MGLCAVLLTFAAPLAGCGLPDDDEKAAAGAERQFALYGRKRADLRPAQRDHQRSAAQEFDSFVGAKSTIIPRLKRLADRIRKEMRVTDVKVKVSARHRTGSCDRQFRSEIRASEQCSI